MYRFLKTRIERVAQEVHALFLGGTHGLKLYVTTMTIAKVCPMCETFFPNFGNSAKPMQWKLFEVEGVV